MQNFYAILFLARESLHWVCMVEKARRVQDYRKRSSWVKVIVFPICKWELLPFPIYFYNIFLDYDVSLHILVVLVVTIPTSPRISKTEFVCGRYRVFGFEILLDRKFKKQRK